MVDFDDFTAFECYMHDVRKTALLSSEEEKRLAKRIAAGDMAARDRLVSANLLFVVKIAKEYVNKGLELDDLVSEGNIGLIKAANRFDASMDVRFTTYAVHWIRQSICKAIADKSRAIRLPVNKHDTLLRVRKTIAQLKSSRKSASLCAVAEACGMKPEAVKDILECDRSIASLDTPVGDGEDPDCFGDFIPCDTALPEEKLMECDMKETIMGALDSLDDRERSIIMRRNGLGVYEEQSLQAIGDAMGLTKERVRQIEKKALEKLSCDKGLAAYAA